MTDLELFNGQFFSPESIFVPFFFNSLLLLENGQALRVASIVGRPGSTHGFGRHLFFSPNIEM